MLAFFQDFFSYSFIIRTVVAGVSISACASLLGVVLVLKRFSMIGDGLSHIGFGTMAIAMTLGFSPLAISIPICILSAFFMLKISSHNKSGDALVAIVSSSALAIGILIASMTSGLNADISSFLFGSVLAISKNDMITSVVLTSIIILLFIIFYKKIFIVTFDENFATAVGMHTKFYNTLIATMTALTIVIGMRLMGALMISSLIVFPALSAMKIFKCFFKVVIFSVIVSIFCFMLGIVISFAVSSPAGASIVIVHVIVFILCSIVAKIRYSGLRMQ